MCLCAAFILVVAPVFLPTACAADITTGLVGHWTFDTADISGSTALDKSGQGNNGSITGAANVSGRIGQALYFNGSGDAVTVPYSASVNLTSSMTLAVWVRPDDPVSAHGAFFENDWSCGYHFGTSCNVNYGTAFFLAGTQVFDFASKLYPDRWTHMAVTFDDNTNEGLLYINGAVDYQTSYAGTIGGCGGGLSIGSRPSGYGQYYKGLLDDARMYNRALTVEDVQALYLLGVGRTTIRGARIGAGTTIR